MVKVNVILPKNYNFNGIRPKINIDVNGTAVSATIIRSTFTPDGAHLVMDIPKDVDVDAFTRIMSQDGAQAYKRALVTVDFNECIQCGQCTAACAYDALSLDVEFKLVVNQENCIGCRTCVDTCVRHCITVY